MRIFVRAGSATDNKDERWASLPKISERIGPKQNSIIAIVSPTNNNNQSIQSEPNQPNRALNQNNIQSVILLNTLLF